MCVFQSFCFSGWAHGDEGKVIATNTMFKVYLLCSRPWCPPNVPSSRCFYLLPWERQKSNMFSSTWLKMVRAYKTITMKFPLVIINPFFIKKNDVSPCWCSSVDWAWAVNQKVTGSISSQGTCLGCGPGPQWGAGERQPYLNVSLLLFLPHIPSV